MKFENGPRWSIQTALAYITELWQQDRITGRMDTEHSSYQRILNAVQAGSMTPEEGVRQAQNLSGGRQEGAFTPEE
jgi:hypothetical protein